MCAASAQCAPLQAARRSRESWWGWPPLARAPEKRRERCLLLCARRPASGASALLTPGAPSLSVHLHATTDTRAVNRNSGSSGMRQARASPWQRRNLPGTRNPAAEPSRASQSSFIGAAELKAGSVTRRLQESSDILKAHSAITKLKGPKPKRKGTKQRYDYSCTSSNSTSERLITYN